MTTKKLTSKTILEKLEREKEKLKEKSVKKIGLFGSYSKNKQKKESDIDFLIEFNEISPDNFFGVLFFLEKLFGKKVDLVIEEDLKPELKYVKKEAKYVEIYPF